MQPDFSFNSAEKERYLAEAAAEVKKGTSNELEAPQHVLKYDFENRKRGK